MTSFLSFFLTDFLTIADSFRKRIKPFKKWKRCPFIFFHFRKFLDPKISLTTCSLKTISVHCWPIFMRMEKKTYIFIYGKRMSISSTFYSQEWPLNSSWNKDIFLKLNMQKLETIMGRRIPKAL